MPILGPLSTFADVDQALSVTAYQAASGFINYLTPTSAQYQTVASLVALPCTL